MKNWTFTTDFKHIIKVFDENGELCADFCRDSKEDAFRLFVCGMHRSATIGGQRFSLTHKKTGEKIIDGGLIFPAKIDKVLGLK